MSIDFDPKNEALLKKTLVTLGWSHGKQGAMTVIFTEDGTTINIANGKAVGEQSSVQKLVTTYALTVVEVQKNWAKSKGWRVETLSPTKIRITRGK